MVQQCQPTDSITGLVNGDGPSAYTGSASLSTTAVIGSPVGSYPIWSPSAAWRL